MRPSNLAVTPVRVARSRPLVGEHRREFVVGVVAVAFLAAYAACMLSEPASYVAYNFGYQVPAMVGIALAIIPVRHSRGRERAGWLLLAVMLAMWNIADWVFAGYTVFLDRDAPFPGLPDVFYLAGYVAFFPAVACLLLPPRRLARGAWMLDALIVMAAAGVISWVYLIEPAAAANSSLRDKLVALSYPVFDLGILAIVVAAVYQEGGAHRERATVIGIAATLLVFADGAYTYSWAVAELDNGAGLLDLLWLSGYWSFALAMVTPGRPSAAQGRGVEFRGAVSFLLPYAVAFPLVVIAMVKAAGGDQSFVLTSGAIGVMALVALRQLAAFASNRALLGRLRQDKEDRDALLRAQSDLGEALLIVDGWRIVFANDAATQLLGMPVEEMLSLPSWAKVLSGGDEDDSVPAFQQLVRPSVGALEASFVRPDGKRVEVEIAAARMDGNAPDRFTVVARDITARRETERALHQARRLESLGLLAGGVAHDFNNILTAILITTGILKKSNVHSEEDAAALSLVEDAARRGAGITSRLLSFSRGGLTEFGRVDLNGVVTDTLRLARPGLTPAVTVQEELPGVHLYVNGDREQLEQALLNIVINARDAMPGGGVIAIRLALEGKTAVVRVSDTGMGMSVETRSHIFEPFFTTKGPGGGTGLGLSTAYGIVQGHRGKLLVESEPGVGTTFTMRLPTADAQEAVAAPLA